MSECLLIRTKDNRKFLTYEKHLPSIIEFAKTFGAEIYQVEAVGKLMELKSLANAICDPQYDENPEHTKIDKLYPKSKKTRDNILKDAAKISRFIRRRLLSGKAISLKELKEKYKDCNVTDACLCNHLATMRRSLTREGHSFEKVGAGKYCLAGS
jgi:hypothetical protein